MFASWRARVREWTVLASSTTGAIVAAGLLIAAIAFIDQRTNLSFGLLYLFPVILVGTVLPRWQVLPMVLLCTWLTRLFNGFSFGPAESLAQDALVFVALAGTGLVAGELTRGRRREIEHVREVEREMAARRGAEEQLTFLINTSPAAIVTVNAGGEVVLANAAAIGCSALRAISCRASRSGTTCRPSATCRRARACQRFRQRCSAAASG